MSQSPRTDAQTDPRMAALANAITSSTLDDGALLGPDALALVTDLSAEDREAMLAHGGKRLLAYRRMVRNRFRRVISDWIPQTVQRLGDRFKSEVADFTEQSAAADPYFRNVPRAFVEWAAPRWRADPSIPAYLVELAEYECLGEDTRYALDPPDPGDPIALGRPILVDPSVAVRRFNFAVDALARTPDLEQPEAETRRLLVYRDGREIKWKVLSELAATLVERLIEADSLQAALTKACEAAGEPVGDEALARIAVLLKEFGDENILHGAG